VQVVMAVLVDLFELLVVVPAAWWREGYWLGLNNAGLTLASFLRHVDALLVVGLLDLDANELDASSR
jgi:hypothetical protein